MSRAILDDHLLRDLLADNVPAGLVDPLRVYEPATTNLYLCRLSKSVATARGGALTGGWSAEHRRSLGAKLLTLPDDIEIVPLGKIAFRMAEIAATHRVSTLGAECLAAVEHLDAPLCVWSGDDGPGIRAALIELELDYRTITRGVQVAHLTQVGVAGSASRRSTAILKPQIVHQLRGGHHLKVDSAL